MNSNSLVGSTPAVPRALRFAVLGVLFAWVGMWVFFVVASHATEGAALLAEGLTVALPLVLLAWLAWKKPRAAGVGLLVAGLAAAWFFRNPAAELALAAPALAFGLFFSWLGWRERRRGAPLKPTSSPIDS